MMTVLLRTFIISLVFLLPSGCGYHIAGTGGVPEGKIGPLPGGIMSLSIPVFENRTGRPDVESVVTTALVNEFMNAVDIVPVGTADAVMEGVIKSYELSPVSFTENDIVREYRLTIVISIRLISSSDGEILWKDNNVTDYEDFFVDPTNVIATKDAEWEALKKMARDRARIIKERMVEGF
jgi:outer membrane lipopolysaccharide assembly protein LptE/RlpB